MQVFSFALIIAATSAFQLTSRAVRSVHGTALKMNFIDSFSLTVAELYANPTATYNGELIDKSIKVVQRAPKPPGYEYGSVADGALPILAIGMLFAVFLGAFIPWFLSIGEGAQAQQREREIDNKIGVNEFAVKARAEREAESAKVKSPFGRFGKK
eukprot:CAMPEP_0182428698 /NCGR_PEP_ID=MMETSP1167-20130531/23215_1 /TAXON_ID=2988 /ORGANISM="Mallomonas Sp, Strain CCMP3275" /LENGTH=155 /DNA_ID=CAMNT_0024611731 /DNA_START=55 /DNA_END=522 /DNA_ORIENTATION=-